MDSPHPQDNDDPPLSGTASASGSGSSPAQQAQDRPQDVQPSQTSPTSTYWATDPPGIMPTPTRPDSPGTALKKEKGRVRFNSNAGANPNPFADPPPSHTPQLRPSPISRPKPSILHGEPVKETTETGIDANPDATAAAQERARKVAARVQRGSPSPDRNSSDSEGEEPPSGPHLYGRLDDIPLQNMSSSGGWQRISPDEETDTKSANSEAAELFRKHTVRRFGPRGRSTEPQEHASGEVQDVASATQPLDAYDSKGNELPLSDKNNAAYDGLYEVAPPKMPLGLLTEILNLYKNGEPSSAAHTRGSSVGSTSGDYTPVTSGSPGTGTHGGTTPKKKWYNQNRSQETLVNLIGASAKLANPTSPKAEKAEKAEKHGKKSGKRPGMHKRTTSAQRLSALLSSRHEEEQRVQVNISNILNRQDYIVKLCRALMVYGAPTHRLEEYLSTSANYLEIAGQFLYLPGCMVISFDDKYTHTAEVRLVRQAQAIDLGKLKDVHHIYKEVIHDVISAEEGRERLEDLYARKDKFNPWLRVLVHGCTSATGAVFSFSARPVDLPLLFCFGCLVGWLQLIVATRYSLYNNVFEISATVMVSFMARAFGSIQRNGEPIFCFSALAQGGIVMLLPGYSVLCSSLELQSRAIIPGSIRIVYAIIYSLFLGFGITVGALFYGLMDSNATSATTCSDPLEPFVGFAFVPAFVVCICLLYQAKWRQMPVMVLVACAGYIVNYFSGKRFTIAPQIANTAGAFTVGVLANLYSRVRHGVAAATLIPAIFTQVPGGLASTGGLISGLRLANEVANRNSTTEQASDTVQTSSMNTEVFSLAASMIQIAIGIAVGLFLSALVIYPLGKRRSGLFSF
ncbi:threonine/serine exporter domain-containing protein [Sarocladium implicatum]|nr:threonine/serine exporter domain-containing protein [Sarocladium implicatum]